MPKCLNDSKKTYKGDEPSPKGLGYSATIEEVGKIMKGKDDNLWIVKLISNGQKRWVKNTLRTNEEELKYKDIITNNKKLVEVEENIIDDKKFDKLKQIPGGFAQNVKILDLPKVVGDSKILQPTIRNANYYHVACDIFPHYRKDDCVGYDRDDYYEEIY
jgi:hypothetical protein